MVIKPSKEAPEACQEVGCKEDKEEQGDKINIVPDLHYVIASTQQELIHDRPEEFEKAVSMNKSGKLEGIETKVVLLFAYEARED